MGREANVRCEWGKESALCKILLESHELIVRCDIRRKVSLSELTKIAVKDDLLSFRAGKDKVSLELGSAVAQRWAKAIATPPPSLATKLGINSASRLLVVGDIEGDELKAAIAEASSLDSEDADLIVAVVKSKRDMSFLLDRLDQIAIDHSLVPPLWVVYEKAATSGVGEAFVRTTLRQHGFIDTKIASVYPKLTALRFIKRAS